MFSNSYYDHSDLADPIKKYLYTSNSIAMSIERFLLVAVDVVGTQVDYLNGTSDVIYRTDNVAFLTTAQPVPYLLGLIIIQATPEFYVYEQYENYQPVMDEVRRNLDTVTVEEKEKGGKGPLYDLFFVMAQLGGFYSFLKLILGGIFEKCYNSMLLADLVNRFNKSAATKDKQRNNLLNGSKISPAEESKSPMEDLELMHMGGAPDYKQQDKGANDQDHLIQENHISRARNTPSTQEYSIMDVVKYSMKCKSAPRHSHDIQNIQTNKLVNFESDLAKFNSETDLIKMVTSIAETKDYLTYMIKTMAGLQESVDNIKDDGHDKQKKHKKSKREKSRRHEANEGIVYDANTDPVKTKAPVQNINKIMTDEINKMVDISAINNSQNPDQMNEGGSIDLQVNQSFDHLVGDCNHVKPVPPPHINPE
jgi:hypothetical protein